MQLPRRDFLRLSAGSVGATLLTPGFLAAAGAPRPRRPESPDRAEAPQPAGPLVFDRSEYAARRARFMKKIPDGIAVLLGARTAPQNNELRYFTGVEVPGAILIMDGRRGESAIFYSTTEDYLRGENLDPMLATDPKQATGIERCYPARAFGSVFDRMVRGAGVIYTPFRTETAEPEVATEGAWDGRLTRPLRFVKLLEERSPGTRVQDCSEMIWEQRRFKTAAEVEAIRHAGRIGAAAGIAVMKAGHPDMYEYELAAVYEYECKRRGASELAFPTIISSAENHRYLHYCQYNRHLTDGDFLVVDAGARWHTYRVDTTISFPINGRFSPRQREIYTAALEISKGAVERYRPGLTGLEVGETIRKDLGRRGFDLSSSAFKRMRYFREAGVTHFVGLETHDAGGTDLPPDRPFEPGMVFASDVFGTWPDENLGVRVENTVLITEKGCEVLNPGVVREIDEIEALVGSQTV